LELLLLVAVVGVAEEVDEKDEDEDRAETGRTGAAGGEDEGEVLAGGLSAEDEDSFPLMFPLMAALLAAVSPMLFCCLLLLVVRLSPPAGEPGDPLDAAAGCEEVGDPGAGETRPGGVAAAAAAEAIRVGDAGRDGMVKC
jgi:hypothetical protein